VTIRKYIENIGVKFKDTAIVMGYDYDCDIKECTGVYKSLRDRNTKDISELLQGYIDQDNIKNSKFAQKGRIDSIGFNYDKGLMSYFRLRDKPIKAIICSDNAFEQFGNLVELKCSDSVRNNVLLQSGLHSSVMAVCPKNCAKEVQLSIYGSALYRDDSSVCRAAIHAGQLVDTLGGVIYVGIEVGQVAYVGKESNKIKSLSYNKYWDRSFVINSYVKKCPIDKFKYYK